MKLFPLAFAAALFAPILATAADVIPPTRLADWTPGVTVGVPSGIPNRVDLIDVTKSPYNADRTGASDCTAAISSAIDTANGTNKVVYLPAGTYRLDGRVYKAASKYTIRGDGDATVIKPMGNQVPFWLGSSAAWDYNTAAAVTGGLSAGSATLALSTVAGFATGQLIRIDQLDDRSIPVLSVNSATTARSRGQTAIIMAVDAAAKTITLSRPLLWSLNPNLSPKAVPIAYGLYATGIGIENLKIDASGSTSTFTIFLEDCTKSWLKDVHIIGSYSYSVYLLACANMEIRHCTFEQLNHAGPNGSLMIVEQTADSLIEDNIFYKASTHMEFNYGCSGNVFAYNYMEDSTIVDTVGLSIDTNHGAHNGFNLIEGNISPKLECDGYFGSTSDDTVFRNWLHGTSPNAYPQHPVLLKRFTRNYNVVGNLLGKTGTTFSSIYTIGTPNIGNDSSSGTASMMNAKPWADWASLLNGTYTAGPSGFQEIDLDVQATLILKANWNSKDGAIPAGEAIGTATLPDSYYRGSNRPAWFGNLTWPAFNPFNPVMKADAIPAGYRFVHGTDPTGGTTTTGTQLPIGVRATRIP